MGIDAQFAVECDPALDASIKAALGDDGHGYPALRRWGIDGNMRLLSISTLDRYYGPGYERGDWPTIAGTIATLRQFGPTWYYSDVDKGPEDRPQPAWTDQDGWEMWQHYLGPDGDAYHARKWVTNTGSSPRA